MSVTPQKLLERLEFYEQRAPVWVANAETIGLSLQQSAVVQTLVDDCRAKYDLAQEKRNEAAAATTNQTAAFEAMDTFGAQMIKIIRAFGIANDDPGVFATAQIPTPKQPEPRAPVNPSNLTFSLQNNGSLELAWDGTIVPGTTFLVDRAVSTGPGISSDYVRVATVSERRFVDRNLPAGIASATYRVVALKGGVETAGTQSTANFVFVGNNQARLSSSPETEAA